MPVPDVFIDHPVVKVRLSHAVQDVGSIPGEEYRTATHHAGTWSEAASDLQTTQATLPRIEPPCGRAPSARFVVRILRGDVSRSCRPRRRGLAPASRDP